MPLTWTPPHVECLLVLVLVGGFVIGALAARQRQLVNFLTVFLVSWAFVVASFVPGCELNALKMQGQATGEHCTYEFGALPNKPPMPLVHDTRPCPDGDVCFTKDMFSQLLAGITMLEGDSADLRRRWTLQVQAYDQECYEH